MKAKLISIIIFVIIIILAIIILLPVKTEYKSKTCGICGLRSAKTKKSFVIFSITFPFYTENSSRYNLKEIFDKHLGYEHNHIWCYQDNGTHYDSYFEGRESGHGRCALNGYSDDFIDILKFSLVTFKEGNLDKLSLEERKESYEKMLKAKNIYEIIQISEKFLKKK